MVAGFQFRSASAEENEFAVLKSEVTSLKKRMADLESKNSPSTGLALPSGFHGVEMSGYVDVSAIYNFQTPDSSLGRGNRGRLFDSEPNGFTPHAVSLSLARQATENSPVGFETTMFFGDDAELMHSVGEGSGTETFALAQAYMKTRLPIGAGIDLKMGKFFTILGLESNLSPLNWNFSRAYLLTYSQPATHTGVLLSYPLEKKISVTAGVVNGWDIVDDNNKGKTLLGGLSFTPTKSATLSLNGITGAEESGNNHDHRTVIDLVGTVKLSEKFSFMANYDRGRESGLTPGAFNTPGPDTAHWEGLALYSKYDLKPSWALAARWEWFHDEDNVRTAFTGPGGQTFSDVTYYEYTLTSQWTFYERLISRLEFRQDRADERVFFKDASGFERHQETIAVECILPF